MPLLEHNLAYFEIYVRIPCIGFAHLQSVLMTIFALSKQDLSWTFAALSLPCQQHCPLLFPEIDDLDCNMADCRICATHTIHRVSLHKLIAKKSGVLCLDRGFVFRLRGLDSYIEEPHNSVSISCSVSHSTSHIHWDRNHFYPLASQADEKPELMA